MVTYIFYFTTRCPGCSNGQLLTLRIDNLRNVGHCTKMSKPTSRTEGPQERKKTVRRPRAEEE